MYKAFSLMLMVIATSGCQSVFRPADFDSDIVGLRCVFIAAKKPFERDNLRYIERYADYGNATCKATLGKLYQEGGYGVSQDFDEARRLFVESAKLDPSYSGLLGQMAERGEGEPIDYAKARDLYRRSGKNAALYLGRLMEEGKGGPQDQSGALALYLDSVNYCGDDAWKAMDRLRRSGVVLDEAQKQRFQELWLKSFNSTQMRRLAVREVFEAVNATGATKSVMLSYIFTSDSGEPQITMVNGSGNRVVDDWIMKAASRITMRENAPLTDSSGKLEINAPLIFSPRDTQDLQWICGRKPC